MVGAILLLVTPQHAFDALLPWLLLTGTVAVAFGRQIGAALRKRVRIGPGAVLVAQALLSVHAGYFGGGVGIGGYLGARLARLARRIAGPWRRGFVIVFSAPMTVVFSGKPNAGEPNGNGAWF